MTVDEVASIQEEAEKEQNNDNKEGEDDDSQLAEEFKYYIWTDISSNAEALSSYSKHKLLKINIMPLYELSTYAQW